MAAVKQAINDAVAQLPNERLAGSQTPPASPIAAGMATQNGPAATSNKTATPTTQQAAVTREEAVAMKQVLLLGTLDAQPSVLGLTKWTVALCLAGSTAMHSTNIHSC